MKKKFNWVDISIVLLLILFSFTTYKYMSRSEVTTVNTTPVEVTVRIYGVSTETVDVINNGDIFKEKDSNQVFGKVINKKVEDAYRAVSTSDGNIVKSKIPNKYVIYVTLLGDAITTNDYIKMGNKDVRLEGTIYLKSNISAVQTKVVDIKIVE